MRHFLIFLIRLYQRFISPYKGFRCAYSRYHPGRTCSGMVKGILAEHGVVNGWSLIRLQFEACREAHERLSDEPDDPGTEPDKPRGKGCLRESAEQCAVELSCEMCGAGLDTIMARRVSGRGKRKA